MRCRWREERRRNYPTDGNVAARAAAAAEARARGDLDAPKQGLQRRLAEVVARQRAMGVAREAGTADLFPDLAPGGGGGGGPRGRGRPERGAGRGGGGRRFGGAANGARRQHCPCLLVFRALLPSCRREARQHSVDIDVLHVCAVGRHRGGCCVLGREDGQGPRQDGARAKWCGVEAGCLGRGRICRTGPRPIRAAASPSGRSPTLLPQRRLKPCRHATYHGRGQEPMFECLAHICCAIYTGALFSVSAGLDGLRESDELDEAGQAPSQAAPAGGPEHADGEPPGPAPEGMQPSAAGSTPGGGAGGPQAGSLHLRRKWTVTIRNPIWKFWKYFV